MSSRSSHPPFRVVIADDHPVFRSGLARALGARPELDLVAEAGDGDAALQVIRDVRPDVAVLDQHMPGRDGVGVARALREAGLEVPVVLLTGGSDDPAALHDALAAGATGYVLKTATLNDICDAIAAVARGEVRFPAELQGSLAASIRARGVPDDTRPVLTEREAQVLRLTAEGRSAADIADELFLSRATVRSHLQSLYQKLGVTDRAAAVATGLRLRLID